MEKTSTKKVEKAKQLQLGLTSPFQNFFIDIKTRLIARLRFFEANRFINDPVVWCFATIMAVGSLYQLLFIADKINYTPELVPLFKSTSTPEFMLVNKVYLFVLPILSLFIFVIAFRNSKKLFYKNDSLSKFILFISSIAIVIISLHLISTLLPYV